MRQVWVFYPGPIWSLQSSPPPPSVAILFIYCRIKKKNTIQKLRLYKFIHLAYSHPLFLRGFGTIRGTIWGTIYPSLRNFPSQKEHRHHIAIAAAALPPPPLLHCRHHRCRATAMRSARTTSATTKRQQRWWRHRPVVLSYCAALSSVCLARRIGGIIHKIKSDY